MNPMTPIIWAGSILATVTILALAYAVVAGTVKAIRKPKREVSQRWGVYDQETETR